MCPTTTPTRHSATSWSNWPITWRRNSKPLAPTKPAPPASCASPEAMAGESEDHGTICMNLSVSLGSQLRGTPCRAFSKDTKVRCGPYRPHTREGLYAYPDLVVVCGPSQYHDQARDVLLNPKVIVEVLSPSTEALDRSEKLYRYRRWLPTLMDYVLVAQDRLLIDHYQRTPT